jgi:Alg9-like mannosyltransferase family.
MTTHISVDKKIALGSAILGIPLLLGFLGSAVQGWPTVFDDAFITYRYAKNLAMGYGITWNPGQAPTEGYTNFLLVVLLAPFIRLGADPLLVTRLLSYLSAVAMSGFIFVFAKRRYGAKNTTAMLIASLILLVPQTRILCLIGLETVLYALLLLVTFHMGVTLVELRNKASAVLFAILLFLTMLLRPEAALLYPLVLLFYLNRIRRSPKLRDEIKPLALGSLVLLATGGAYLTWKYVHFGHLLPNPFHLKLAGASLFSPAGADSVSSFVSGNSLVVALACASLLLCLSGDQGSWSKGRLPALLGLGFAFLYVCLFIHADTYMDVGGRFMFPLLPLLMCVSVPALAQAISSLESRTGERLVVFSGLVVIVVLAFGARDLLGMFENAKRLVPEDEEKTDHSLMQRELGVAKTLSTFPDISQVRIAFGDSGVIPYFTGAVWLDVVGINDGAIARSRNREALLDHFFGFEADLVIHPGGGGRGWITYGHGPLGDYESWADDPRWDDYHYVGTVTTNVYDLQFILRTSSPHYHALKEFLRRDVVDGWYEVLPLRIGTSKPSGAMPPVWVQRPMPRG